MNQKTFLLYKKIRNSYLNEKIVSFCFYVLCKNNLFFIWNSLLNEKNQQYSKYLHNLYKVDLAVGSLIRNLINLSLWKNLFKK